MKLARTVLLGALFLIIACAPAVEEASAPAASARASADRAAYKLEIHFRGLTTLVPDDTDGNKLWAMLGDFQNPSKVTVRKAMLGGQDTYLAKHQARLYFENLDGGATVSGGWSIQTVSSGTCALGYKAADRFVVLDGEDIVVVGNLKPPLVKPLRPAKLPKVPNGKVGKDSWGWVPALHDLTGQKINAAFFNSRPCGNCASTLAARFLFDSGMVTTNWLWEEGFGVYKTWRFENAAQRGPHAMAGDVEMTATVTSGTIKFESKPFDGKETRWLELPALDGGTLRSVWITNQPFDASKDLPGRCKGSVVDFIGHHNLLANPGEVVKNPPFPVEDPVEPLEFDAQCSPAGGRR